MKEFMIIIFEIMVTFIVKLQFHFLKMDFAAKLITMPCKIINVYLSECRVLVKAARKLAQQYYLVYQEQIPTSQLVQRVANVMQEYTQSG